MALPILLAAIARRGVVRECPRARSPAWVGAVRGTSADLSRGPYKLPGELALCFAEKQLLLILILEGFFRFLRVGSSICELCQIKPIGFPLVSPDSN